MSTKWRNSIHHNQSLYIVQYTCGYQFKGRPSLIKMMVRLHRKKCSECSKLKDTLETLETFFGLDPPRKNELDISMHNKGIKIL